MVDQTSHSRSGWSDEQVSVVNKGEKSVTDFISDNPDVRKSYENRRFEELRWYLRSKNSFNELMVCTAVVKKFKITDNGKALVTFDVPETGHQIIRRYSIPQSVDDVDYDNNQLLRLNAYASHSISYVTLTEGDRFPALLDVDIYEIWI